MTKDRIIVYVLIIIAVIILYRKTRTVESSTPSVDTSIADSKLTTSLESHVDIKGSITGLRDINNVRHPDSTFTTALRDRNTGTTTTGRSGTTTTGRSGVTTIIATTKQTSAINTGSLGTTAIIKSEGLKTLKTLETPVTVIQMRTD